MEGVGADDYSRLHGVEGRLVSGENGMASPSLVVPRAGFCDKAAGRRKKRTVNVTANCPCWNESPVVNLCCL